MDAKAEFNKLVKEISASAKEFAAYGLQYGSKALDYTANALKNAEAGLKARAEKLVPKKDEGNGKPAPETSQKQ
jgi:hypothetical protein